ncbi:HTH_Tnp_Tc3_2 domain-containing protein [Trichonephila clavipes]|nr:HTH_Tnp_Tc3_2 domain-containing protein [Trichonephila clavipes]
MAGYQDFSEFERGIIVGTPEMGHSISQIMQEWDKRQLTKIIKRDRRETLPKIVSDFNDGPITSVIVRTIQRNTSDMGFRRRRPTRVPLLTA